MKQIAGFLAVIVLATVVLTACVTMTNKKEQNNTSTNDLQISANAGVDVDIEAYVDGAFELLKENGKASEKIWPEYDLSQNAIIVCQRDDVTNKIIRAWELTTSNKRNLTNEELSGMEIPAAGGYSSIEFEGKKSIIIAVSKDTSETLKRVAITNFVYEIGVHEMVHFHYESFFKLTKLAMEQKFHGGRGTAFPKAAEPRVYRKMLYDNLVAAFENPEDEKLYLGRAKYWNEKWKNEYPDEYYQIKVTDIMEGKARYIQYMLCMPNHMDDMERKVWIADHFDKSKEPSDSMDTESYKLGFAAGVLLDRQGTDWKKQISRKPEPMVEYLLKNVEPIEDNPETYEAKLKTSKAQMDKINKEIDGKLENIKKAEDNVQIPFLQINGKYLEGSFETSDFLNYRGKSLTIDFGGKFQNENGKMTVNHLSVYEKSGLRKSTFTIPLTMEYKLSDERLLIDSEEVSGDILVKQTKDKDGRIIYIMK